MIRVKLKISIFALIDSISLINQRTMTIQQLEYILAVDQFRHFAKAAEYCRVTQPTLSAMIQKLEDELGVKLFDRSMTPVCPTAIGKKVLEQARDPEAGQAADFQHPGQRGVKVGAERKADAAHAGVGLQVDLHPAACGHSSIAQGLGLRCRVAGHRDMVLDQGRRVAGLHMAQHQNGQGQPALAQLNGLSQAAHGQPGGTLFRKNAGALHGAVAVAVGLDHCAQRQSTGTGLDRAEIMAKGFEVDLGPDMFFKGLGLHHDSSFFAVCIKLPRPV